MENTVELMEVAEGLELIEATLLNNIAGAGSDRYTDGPPSGCQQNK